MSGNQDQFDVITRAVADVRDWYGTREVDGDYRGRLLAAAIEANGGRRNDLVDRIVAYQAEVVGRGQVKTPKGTHQGRGVHAKRRQRLSSTRICRDETTYLVGRIIDAAVESTGKTPSVPAIRKALAEREWRSGDTAVRTGFRAHQRGGSPVIARHRRRLTRPAQDLILAFEEALPKSALSVTTFEECLRKLYLPSSKADTRRSQIRRVEKALAELESASRIGISIMRYGSLIFVGRGRAVPESAYKWGKENSYIKRSLTPGLVSGRLGLWASPEGVMARDMIEGMHDHAPMHVAEGLSQLHDIPTTDQIEAAEETAYAMRKSAKAGCLGAADMRRGADERILSIRQELDRIEAAYVAMTGIYHCHGLVALWQAAQQWPGLKAKANDPAAQRRIARIARRFAEIECPDRQVESERFAHVLWRDMPKAQRSPVEPQVSEYRPRIPKLTPISIFVRRAEISRRHRWTHLGTRPRDPNFCAPGNREVGQFLQNIGRRLVSRT